MKIQKKNWGGGVRGGGGGGVGVGGWGVGGQGGCEKRIEVFVKIIIKKNVGGRGGGARLEGGSE